MSLPASSAPIFEGVPDAHVQWALGFFKQLDVPYGTVLIEEGEEDQSLICVVEGELEVRTGGVQLATPKKGELVGEVALFSGGVRTASVEALTQARLLVLPRDGYIQLRNAMSPVAHAIEEIALDLLVKRLRRVTRRIGELAEGTPIKHTRPSVGFFSRVASLFGGGAAQLRAADVDAVALLARSPLFADATEEALAEIGERTAGVAFSAGSFLCTEGEVGREMYLLDRGAVDVVVATHEDRVEPLCTLDAGSAFGMCALVENLPRMASCIARVEGVALRLDREVWSGLILSGGVAGSVLRTAMIRCLSEQLSYANAQLAQLDISRTLRETRDFAPLLRASVGVETYGRHLTKE